MRIQTVSWYAGVVAALATVSTTAISGGAAQAKVRALLVTGQNNHNWRETTPHIKAFLEATGRFVVDVTEDPGAFFPRQGALAPYAVLVLNYNGADWGDVAKKAFLGAVRAGTGVSVIHAANNAFPGWTEYEQLVGITWRSTAGHGDYHEFPVRYVVRDHPVSRGLPDMAAHPDELYHRLTPAPGEPMTILALAFSDTAKGGTGKDEPMALVKTFGKGRVFHTPLGHDLRAMKDPQFMLLTARGTEWSATGSVTVKDAPRLP